MLSTEPYAEESSKSLSLLYLSSNLTGTGLGVTRGYFANSIEAIKVNGAQLTNKAVSECTGSWILLMSVGGLPRADVLIKTQELICAFPGASIFVPIGKAGGATQSEGPGRFLNSLCVSGLLIKKQFLIELSGFNQACETYMDIELLMRCYKSHQHLMVEYAAQELLADAGIAYTLAGGPGRVLRSTEMFKKAFGHSPVVWFKDYAAALHRNAATRADQSTLLPEIKRHLAELAAKVAHHISPDSQGVLGSYLQRSVFEGEDQAQIYDVDQTVLELFPNQKVGCELPAHFSAFSLGDFCHSAQLLKELTLRQKTGPLDWIFTQIHATTHMIKDRFTVFLEQKNCVPVPDEEKTDVHSCVADNIYYKEQFGVRFMFNHHNLNLTKDLALFEQGKQDLMNAVGSDAPTLLLLLSHKRYSFDSIEPLALEFNQIGTNNVLLVINLKRVSSNNQTPSVQVEHRQDLNSYLAIFETTSSSTGLEFGDALDNVRLKRFVHGVALGCFAK